MCDDGCGGEVGVSELKRMAVVCVVGVVCLWGTQPAMAQRGAAGGEWRGYGGGPGGTKYLPLDQIHPANVKDLRVAWRWRSVDYDLVEQDPDLRFNPTLLATPLMVGGRLLMSTNLGRAAAIDPATGETVWVYRALEDGAGRPRRGGGRAAWATGTMRRATTSGFFS